jgi:hypothetical protein
MIPKIGTQRTSVWSKLTTLRETPKGCAGDLILNLVTARQGVITGISFLVQKRH